MLGQIPFLAEAFRAIGTLKGLQLLVDRPDVNGQNSLPAETLRAFGALKRLQLLVHAPDMSP